MSRRAGALVALVAVLAGVGLYVLLAEPVFIQRVRYPLRYQAIVIAHAHNYDLDPALLAAVIYTESRFDSEARSSAGAIGLMQLLPETAQGIATRTGGKRFVVSDLYVPELNVRYGAWYLRHLIDRYGVQTRLSYGEITDVSPILPAADIIRLADWQVVAAAEDRAPASVLAFPVK